MTPTELIAGGYRMARRMVHMMCDDLTPDEFRHQPVPGANSAAWVVGHLAVTARRTAERLGATGLPVLTEEFIGRYSATKKPAGPQTDLGDKADLLALLDGCVEKLTEAVGKLPAEALTGPPPSTSRFATNYGEAVLFGALHVTMHCGQLSTIRRSLGKPPVV
jgi:uncharacterized damage-inducible protein DinB